MPARTCIITGASRGIGLATALRFARDHCNIVAVARHEEMLQHAAAQIRAAGADCLAIPGDVGDAAAIKRIVRGTVERFGRIDVLVNNAGFGVLKPLEQTTHADFAQSLAVNVHAVFHATQAVWPVMRQQGGGVIVNLSSVSSVDPFRGFAVYGACKAWVNVFSQATADEGRQLGIRVYAVAPGAVDTQMLRQVLPNIPPEKTLAPEQVAEIIGALCDERMGPLTGQTLFPRK